MFRDLCHSLLSVGVGALLVIAASPALSVPAMAQQGPVCEGYSGKALIRGFGGSATFSKKPAESPDDLLRILREHEEDLRSVMDSQGVGNLTDDVLEAVETGLGLSERNVGVGETFEWVTFRKKSGVDVVENACFAPRGRQQYGAYQVEITEKGEPMGPDCDRIEETRYQFLFPKICVNPTLANVEKQTETLEPIPAPVCQLTASRSGDPSLQISVDAGGSSEEVEVVMASGGSTETVIPQGSANKTWTGRDENPYDAVKVVAQGVNEDLCGRAQRCEKTVTLEPYVRPSCIISIDPEGEQRAGRAFTVDVDGEWRENGLEVTVRRGDKVVEEISHPSTSPLSQEMKLRAGDYVIEGVATNVIDDEATCQALVEVRSQWKIRPHAAYWDVDDDSVMLLGESVGDPSNIPVREKFSMGDGVGFGVGLEYYFTDRIGLEGELEITEIEGTLVFDRFEDWALDTDDGETFALFIGPNFHLTPNRSFDLYLGPLAGWVDIGSLDFQTFDVNTDARLDSEFVFGARLGIDVPFRKDSPWAFNASARLLDLTPEVQLTNALIDETFDVDLNPVTVNVGVAYSF